MDDMHILRFTTNQSVSPDASFKNIYSRVEREREREREREEGKDTRQESLYCILNQLLR